MSRIRPVILAGGPGARLWPASDAATPKPFLKLDGENTLLGLTLARLDKPDLFAPPIITCAAAMAELSRDAMRAAGIAAPELILEPAPRDTAAAIAAVAAARAAEAPDELVLVLPADHVIEDPGAFQAACARGADAAAGGRFTLFGVEPDGPHTGFGYIEAASKDEVATVAVFHEKPDLPTAEQYYASGKHLWNAGMFLAPVATFAHAFETHAPEIYAVAKTAVAGATREAGALVLDADVFATAPKEAFDRAVVEKLKGEAAVIRLSCGWSDVGAWDAVYDLLRKNADDDGNATVGAVALLDAKGVLASTSGPKIAVMGVKDIAVVASPNGVLVCSRDQAQRVKDLIARFKS